MKNETAEASAYKFVICKLLLKPCFQDEFSSFGAFVADVIGVVTKGQRSNKTTFDTNDSTNCVLDTSQKPILPPSPASPGGIEMTQN